MIVSDALIRRGGIPTSIRLKHIHGKGGENAMKPALLDDSHLENHNLVGEDAL